MRKLDIGARIKAARLEAGLSQRQLCGDKITRNMLSQIENGTARPSMDTLTHLARQLGKSVSYFLDEAVTASPNTGVMAQARAALAQGRYEAVLALGYQGPDPMFDAEWGLLRNLCLLALAGQAKERGQGPLAMQLLDQIDTENPYFSSVLQRNYQLLAGVLPVEDDRELLLRAEKAQDPAQAIAYLKAVENRESSRRNLLMGKAYLSLKDYENAIPCLQKGEKADPKVCLSALEICYRELGDFENAYRCACTLRNL